MSKSKSNQSKPHYEFLGPPGAAFIMISLPLTVYALYYMCNRDGCVSVTHWTWNPPSWDELFSLRALLVYLGWITLHCVLYVVVPGETVKGIPLDKQGNRLEYKNNGLLSSLCSVAVIVGLVVTGIIPSTFAYDEFVPLVTSAVLFCIGFSVCLYVYSLFADSSLPSHYLSPHGQTGNMVYDLFVGRSLNPRVFGIDLKYMCELRPGLVGWILIDVSFACAQYKYTGTLTASMLLVLAFQSLYVVDALVSESAILTTMDITTDGFGYMLVFGDLCWVPFTYSLQARYLVDYPTYLSVPAIIAILCLKCCGMYIFRSANNQKNEFRSGIDSQFTRNAQFILTESGTKLLVSGWWGRARHANYMGDLLMALSWSLPCGFSHPIPYFYPVYFAILLIHRERRDDAKCRKKYGKEWEKYCQLVPYRIFPYIY